MVSAVVVLMTRVAGAVAVFMWTHLHMGDVPKCARNRPLDTNHFPEGRTFSSTADA